MTPKQILQARARDLARPPVPQRQDGEAVDVIEFRLAHERYAVDRADVREVCTLTDLTLIPGLPAFYRGVVNVRRQILPVIDLKKFFDLPETGITDLHVILIVSAGEMEVGLLADVTAGVRAIPVASLQPPLPTLTGIRSQYLKGVTDDHIVVLDVSKILGDPKLVVNEQIDA